LIDKRDNIRRIPQEAPRTVPPDGDPTFSLAYSYHPLAYFGRGCTYG